jgi:hypothetical protein
MRCQSKRCFGVIKWTDSSVDEEDGEVARAAAKRVQKKVTV